MIFEDYYQLTDAAPEPVALFQASPYLEGEYKHIKAGTYNSGLFTVCGISDYSDSSLESWSHLVGKEALLIGYLGWGDFICASFEYEEFYLVLSQENHKISLGNLLKGVFDINLPDNEFRQELMWEEKYKSLVNLKGELKYKESFTTVPWQMLGGPHDLSAYEKVDFGVYIDLVGQEWQKRI